VIGVHHTAIVTGDVNRALKFWRDGLGFAELMDYTFTGDWSTLFEAETDTLRSVFLGDPTTPDTGIVELVVFDGVDTPPPGPAGPAVGFFLISLQRDVAPALERLAGLGFTEGVRRISMPAPGGKSVEMAVVTAPDGVRVELVGAAS
jgi:catechol 2,3-dioxygenase-like lactoylglutathione lyase family enzyme